MIQEGNSEELIEEETGQCALGFVQRVTRQLVRRVEIQEVTTQDEPIREVVNEYTVHSPNSSDSFDSYFNFPSPPADKYQSRKMKKSDFEGDEAESSQEVITEMSKRIKLLEEEIKKMSETQLKMKNELESLSKKNVKKATKPAIKKLGEVASKFEKSIGDQERVQRMVNL